MNDRFVFKENVEQFQASFTERRFSNRLSKCNERGENVPYTPRHVVFQADNEMATSGGGLGVKVSSIEESDVEPLRTHRPGHPDADADGYVYTPNIDMTTELNG